MSLVDRSWHWLQNFDTTFDGHWPNGDKPTGTPALQWAASGYPVIDTLVINHAYSEEIRAAHLTGGDAGLATITIDQVSGDNYASEGWAMTGDNLTHPSNSNQGAGVFRHKAEYGGAIEYSTNRSWAYLPPPEIQIKWNPGYYIILYPDLPLATYTTHVAEIVAINAILPGVVKGIQLYVRWGETETAKNVYDFTRIDQVFTLAKNNNLRFRIVLMNFRNGSAPGPCVPAYVASEPNSSGGWQVFPTNYVRARLDASGTMARWKVWMTALGTHLDSDAKFEGCIVVYDSVIYDGSLPAGFSYTAWQTQYISMIAHAAVAFPNSNVWCGLDFGFTQNLFPDIVDAMAAGRCGLAGPDSVAKNAFDSAGNLVWSGIGGSTNGMRAVMGMKHNGTTWIPGVLPDRRGVIPIGPMTEAHDMGGVQGGPKPDELYTYHLTINKMNHVAFLRKDFAYASPTYPFIDWYWDNTKSYAVTPRHTPDMKTWLSSAAHTLVTAAPSSYPTVVTGG